MKPQTKFYVSNGGWLKFEKRSVKLLIEEKGDNALFVTLIWRFPRMFMFKKDKELNTIICDFNKIYYEAIKKEGLLIGTQHGKTKTYPRFSNLKTTRSAPNMTIPKEDVKIEKHGSFPSLRLFKMLMPYRKKRNFTGRYVGQVIRHDTPYPIGLRNHHEVQKKKKLSVNFSDTKKVNEVRMTPTTRNARMGNGQTAIDQSGKILPLKSTSHGNYLWWSSLASTTDDAIEKNMCRTPLPPPPPLFVKDEPGNLEKEKTTLKVNVKIKRLSRTLSCRELEDMHTQITTRDNSASVSAA
jgi:hypothetical protein